MEGKESSGADRKEYLPQFANRSGGLKLKAHVPACLLLLLCCEMILGRLERKRIARCGGLW